MDVPMQCSIESCRAHGRARGTQTGTPTLSADTAAMAKKRLLRFVEMVGEAVVVIALLAELVLVVANVIDRAWFRHSFLWADEAARLSLSILAFIGGAVAYRRRDDEFVAILLDLVAPPIERICLVLSDVIVLFVVGLAGIASAQFIASSWAELTPLL